MKHNVMFEILFKKKAPLISCLWKCKAGVCVCVCFVIFPGVRIKNQVTSKHLQHVSLSPHTRPALYLTFIFSRSLERVLNTTTHTL